MYPESILGADVLKTSKKWVDNVINIIILSIFLLNKRQYVQKWVSMITLINL